MPLSDQELVAAFLRRRDERRFRELYQRHAPLLYAFTLRLAGGDVSEAEDALQETWIRATERLARFEWQASLRTWLCGIALNCWRERRRARGNLPLTFDEVEAPAAPEADGAARLDLERAIADLPQGYRTIVILHDVEGYTHEEIAAMLDIDSGTSRSQLSRARQTLRSWLGGSIRSIAAT